MLEALRSDPGACPGETRQRILRVIREVAGADAALWYTMADVDEGFPIPVQWKTLDIAESALRRMRDERLRWLERDPRRPLLREIRGFQSLATLITDLAAFQQSPVYHRLFVPHRIRDQLRLLVYSGDRFIGWVGGLRRVGSSRFTRADARRLQPYRDAIASALVQADAAERAGCVEEACDLFVRPDGYVEYASERGRRWLEDTGNAVLVRRWARDLDRDGQSPRHLGGWPLRWSRLSGRRGSRLLLHVSPPHAVVVHPIGRLTTRQREVAKLAAAGATVPEIARMTERSPETVRSHLREVYQRLDIASRAELARVVVSGFEP